MKNHYVLALGATVATLLCGGATHADEVVISSLEATDTGGFRAPISPKLTLSTTKPEGVKREPAYRYKASYGSITLGDAKENSYLVILDSDEGAPRPMLYVDVNGNGDLTDDPIVRLTPAAGANSTPRFTASVPLVAKYNVVGRGGKLTSVVNFTVWGKDVTLNREYGRTGTLSLGNRTYKIGLVDQNIDGRFDQFKHENEDQARVLLLVDRNSDGKFSPQKEAFDASKPFRLAGQTIKISSIDTRGTRITFQASLAKPRVKVTAKSLHVGGEPIEFEADAMEGDSVMFPDDYKGKLVMLDFWAVWCPPCREEVPNLVKVYERYQGKGFEILGISLDKENESGKVKSYTKEHGMTWSQVYDGKYWEAEIAKLYGIDAIPAAFLVDGDTGKILAMGDELRGAQLEKTLQKALALRKRKE